MSKKYSKDFLNKCYKKYNEGNSMTKIASEFNVDRKRLAAAIKTEFNISNLKRNYEAKRSLYCLNEVYFESVDTEEKAYWLGFLYADGYLKKDKPVIEISLKASDSGHLDKFKHAINSNHKTYLRDVKLKDKTYSSCRLCLYNKQMHGDLIKLGCTNNKSLVLKYPDFISSELQRHFIRGFFDGDGNISLESNSQDRISRVRFFCGSEDFIKDLTNRLNAELNMDISYKWDRTCFALIYGRQIDKMKILDYLYKDCNIYLDRKYELYKKYACRFES